jgi:glycosyltransferase involved in cell wall biosynthesis
MCVPSSGARDAARRFFDGRIEIIPNPVDVERFHPGRARVGWFRDRYCANGSVLAAVVGRIAREKNLDLVCELLGKDERIDLVFVGDGPYADTLKRRWGVRVTGFLQGKDLVEAFQQADVLVQLSRTETFGLSLVEALACGLPAMVLRSQGFVERIPPRSGVEVLEQEELDSLADRCVNLVSNREEHNEHARRVRELVLDLDAKIVLPKFEEFHRSFAF